MNRLETAHDVILLVLHTIEKSSLALVVMFGFVIVAMVFFGSIIYAIEGGTFRVTIDHPQGAYLRPTINHDSLEVSPYYSIGTSFYWVVVTCTTGE